MRGLTYNAENALYNGRKVFGYTGKQGQKYQVDTETAPIVRRIFKDYAEGVPMLKICEILNDAGLRTARGNEFTVSTLHGILKNRS